MTFPMGRTAAHPSLPRRPQREPSPTPPPRAVHPYTVHSDVELKAGERRVISTTSDRLHIRRERERATPKRKLLFAFRFARGTEIALLERAIQVSKATWICAPVGRIFTPIPDVSIDLSADAGRVLIRFRKANDALSPTTTIRGLELIALERALHEFKTAAHAAKE